MTKKTAFPTTKRVVIKPDLRCIMIDFGAW